jgi:dTDP-4-dehydrorhamnose 3,5-epimerase
MKISTTKFEGLLIFEPTVFNDSRGYFFESFSENKLIDAGLKYNFIQDNQSYSKKNVIRGLHFQSDPFPQNKLVRAIRGNILDVVVDIRNGSKTFGQWYSIELSGENQKQLLVPSGFAHGFSVLSEDAIVSYKVDNVYKKEYEVGIVYNDKTLNIDWGVDLQNCIVSEKDKVLSSFLEIKPY